MPPAYDNVSSISPELPLWISERGKDASEWTDMNQGKINVVQRTPSTAVFRRAVSPYHLSRPTPSFHMTNKKAPGTSTRTRGEDDDDDSPGFSDTNCASFSDRNNNTNSSSSSDPRINAMEEGKGEKGGGEGGGTVIPRAASDQSSRTCGESGDDYPTSPSNASTNINIGSSSDLCIDIVNEGGNGGRSPAVTSHALGVPRSGAGGGGGDIGGGTVRRADNIPRTNKCSPAPTIHTWHSAAPPDEEDAEEGEAQEDGEAHEEPAPGEDRNQEPAGWTLLQVFWDLVGPFILGTIGLPTVLHIIFPDFLSFPHLLTACSGATVIAIRVRIKVLVAKNIIGDEDAETLHSIFKNMGRVIVFCFGVSILKVVTGFV